MIITPIDVSDYPQRIIAPYNATRSHGVHLTDIIRDMAAAIGKSKGDGTTTEDDLDWYASGGWLWERVWDRAHRESIQDGSVYCPGEIELDGIVGTPDRVRIEDGGDLTLIELKSRWSSAYKFDSLEKNYWQELMQIQSYCQMVQTTHAELCVFFVAGNWRPPVPCARAVGLEWTERELVDNWSAVTGHARRRGWIK
jgi:hypothetical protein